MIKANIRKFHGGKTMDAELVTVEIEFHLVRANFN